jgi:hypothetical protein
MLFTCFFHGNIPPDIRCVRHIPLSLESKETGLLHPQRLASVPVNGHGAMTAGVAGTAEVHPDGSTSSWLQWGLAFPH